MFKKIIILSVSIILLFAMYFFGGFIFINPFIADIAYKIRPTPNYSKILNDYKIRSIVPSINSPWAVFPYEIDKNFNDSELGYGTGLFNVENKEVVVLAPDNWLPKNTSLFSPNGNQLLFVKMNKVENYKNEYGNWRRILSFDLYRRDLKNNLNIKIAENISGDVWGNNFFGWIDDNTLFYLCSEGTTAMFCIYSIQEKTITKKPSVNSVSSDSLPVDSKISNGGYSFDRTKKIQVSCVLHGFDGCAYSIVKIEEDGQKKFLGNSKDLRGDLQWTYGNHLFFVPFVWGTAQSNVGILQIR